MATLTLNSLTEQAKRLDPDLMLSKIIEVLDREMPIFSDAPWKRANDIWVNKTTRRSSLPTGTWRKLNSGVSPSRSKVQEVMDTIGMLEDFAEYDVADVNSYPNPAAYRFGEMKAFIEGLAQTFVSALLFSDATITPEKFHGIAPRLATIDSQYVFGNGGTGNDLTSIYVVDWSEEGCYLTYPRNMQASLGIEHRDLGESTKEFTDGSLMQVFRDQFKIMAGFVVRDPRRLGRVANIETAGSSNTFDEDLLIKLLGEMKTSPNTRIYMNQTIMSQMRIALKDKGNVDHIPAGGEGLASERIVTFDGFQVRKIHSDILVNTESAIT